MKYLISLVSVIVFMSCNESVIGSRVTGTSEKEVSMKEVCDVGTVDLLNIPSTYMTLYAVYSSAKDSVRSLLSIS